MSIFTDLDAMVLRSVVNPPLVTKGAELDYTEWDNRIVAIYNAIQSIVSGVNVTAYNPATTYDDSSTDIYKRFAGYNGRAWKAIGTFTGQTPEDGIYWEQVTLSELMPNVLKVAEVADSSGAVLKEASLTIASADVLQLNSTPLTIVPAVSGYAIEVISASVKINFNTTAYATNTNIQLIIDGADDNVGAIGNNILAATVSVICSAYAPSNPSSRQTQVLSNAALQVYVSGGNPTAGDSEIEVFLLYRLIPV